MQRISSASPHKIQPHQKDLLNSKSNQHTKRAAAKVVRRKINDSQQLSKASMNITNSQNETSTKATINMNLPNKNEKLGIQIPIGEPQFQRSDYMHSKIATKISNPSSSLLSPQKQIQQTHQHNIQSNSLAQKKLKPQMLIQRKDKVSQQEEEKQLITMIQKTHSPQRSIKHQEKISSENYSEIRNNSIQNLQKCSNIKLVSHKPSISLGGQNQFRGNDNKQVDGEKILNKRHQMRLTSGENKRQPANQSSRIYDGSEDFTNIEERLLEDTRISIRNAVASSLNNVSIMLKQAQSKQTSPSQKQLQQLSIRHRRGTTQSNLSGVIFCPSNQVSKEETFETSSFFDEHSGGRGINKIQGIGISSHQYNSQDEYKLPTIFNTLMYGIDQNKVSEHVRQSFTNISLNAQSQQQSPKQMQQQNNQPFEQQHKDYQQKLSAKFAQNQLNESLTKSNSNVQNNDKLSQYITKVDQNTMLSFDQKINTLTQQTRNNELNNQQKSESNTGRQSQLSLAVQQNLKIEQTIEAPETLNTEEQIKSDQQAEFNENQEDQLQQENFSPSQQLEEFQSSELHRTHLIQTLQSLQYIKTLPPVKQNDIKQRTIRLPQPKHSSIKKTLIFDLDETLVHCVDDIENNPCHHVINVTFPNGDTVQAGINIRPYAIECLKKANENYQVVVFTASHKAYADVVLDLLDPDHSLIQYRLYREHCIRTEEGIYIKDLRIIQNRQLKDLIIVDNAVYSFGYQLDNGIPIIPYYDDNNDEELMHLIFYFNCLATCIDVREQNRKAFQLKDLQEINITEYLSSMMNQNNHQYENDEQQ